MKVTPQTRRMVVIALASIAVVAIVAEVIVLLSGNTTSESLLTIAATSVGGLAGLAVPGVDSSKEELSFEGELASTAPLTNPFVDGTTHELGDLEEWDDGEEVEEGETDDTEDSSPQRP